MARPSTLPVVFEELKTFLDLKDAEFEQSGRGAPTLPSAKDGKVNVRMLMRNFREWATEQGHDVPESVWQYVYTNAEWASLINTMAVAQGLKAIGSRAVDGDGAENKLVRLRKEIKDQSEGHAHARARIARLERRLAEAEAENGRLKARLSALRRTGMLPRVDDLIR